jgi:hypothetical protein
MDPSLRPSQFACFIGSDKQLSCRGRIFYSFRSVAMIIVPRGGQSPVFCPGVWFLHCIVHLSLMTAGSIHPRREIPRDGSSRFIPHFFPDWGEKTRPAGSYGQQSQTPNGSEQRLPCVIERA